MQLISLLAVMLISGLSELVSLGAALPFLAVLSDPDELLNQPYFSQISLQLGIHDSNGLIIFATIAFASAAILAASIRLINLWINGRLAASIGSDLSCEAYRRTLYQPYTVHVRRNSSAVITTTTSQISRTVGAISAFLQLITSTIVALGLLTGLFLIDAGVALAAAILFVSAYIIVAFATRKELRLNGQKITSATSLQLKALQEGLGAIREVLLDGSQATYLKIYKQADRPQRLLEAKNSFLGTFPRYVLEALGMVTIAVLGCLLVFQRGSGTSVIPVLGGLAIGAQRLLPALQQIYNGWASLKGYNDAMQGVLEMLNQQVPNMTIGPSPISFNDRLLFDSVTFRYEQSLPNVIDKINLDIKKGDRIGLIGSTGSGKSTTVDLLMGLLEPTEGVIYVDNVNMHALDRPDLIHSWRSAIAHVPQAIYLSDSSITENIAFGLEKHDINFERVELAARQAQLHDFINSTEKGYDTIVGERGIRLSGGQRQRIGIARALYKNARILVFDEATSALDNSTEKSVMAAINSLSQDLTVIIIAHRLSTVQSCNRVIRLENGTVIADGPPAIILGKNIDSCS
ncbi:ABC transporter ATP-binding protein [Synechococcus sp. MIT S9451]|uniref:ABC transporter ATP-binding protein n=1 Tax=Synechococcus sp. MIT S9451 TaxID=3082543 RepID=UPI0039B507D5